MTNTKKFLYFGTPETSSKTLKALLDAGYIPEAVVTNPPAPAGRGRHLVDSPTALLANEHNIKVLTPSKITPEVIEELSHFHAEYAIVVAYGKILPQALIDLFPLKVFNIHYSLLPLYRGASPVESALLHNEKETGISIQEMVFEMDAGDCLSQLTVDIEESETTTSLRERLIPLGAQELIRLLPAIETSSYTKKPQDTSKVSFAKKIMKSEGQLDLSGDQLLNWCKYRAFYESPGTFFMTEKDGKPLRVKIVSATFSNGTFTPDRVIPESKNETFYKDFLKTIS